MPCWMPNHAPDHARPKFRDLFNVECASRGLHTFVDEHYANWAYKFSDADISNSWFLRSLTPHEERAVSSRTAATASKTPGESRRRRRRTASRRSLPPSRKPGHSSQRSIVLTQDRAGILAPLLKRSRSDTGRSTSSASWNGSASGCGTLDPRLRNPADHRVLRNHPSPETPAFPASPAEAIDGTISAVTCSWNPDPG